MGGGVLLAFAAVWVSITVFSAVSAKKTVRGTLVLAATLGLIGTALLYRGYEESPLALVDG